MRCTALLILVLFLAMPLATHAARNAGVVHGVWFSNTSPEAGELVTLYTAVQNTTDESVTGAVAFLVDGNIVGTTPFTVAPNNVVAVSTQHMFSDDGARDVSAYITAVDGESVTSTTVPKTSLTIAPSSQPVAEPETPQQQNETSDIVKNVTNTVTKTSKETVKKIEPITESTAQKIEDYRDTLIAGTSTTSVAETPSQPNTDQTEPTNFIEHKKQAAHDFVTSAKEIAAATSTPIWTKAAGIGLSLAALAVRFWFVLVVLVVGLAFWLLTRGSRIV